MTFVTYNSWAPALSKRLVFWVPKFYELSKTLVFLVMYWIFTNFNTSLVKSPPMFLSSLKPWCMNLGMRATCYHVAVANYLVIRSYSLLLIMQFVSIHNQFVRLSHWLLSIIHYFLRILGWLLIISSHYSGDSELGELAQLLVRGGGGRGAKKGKSDTETNNSNKLGETIISFCPNTFSLSGPGGCWQEGLWSHGRPGGVSSNSQALLFTCLGYTYLQKLLVNLTIWFLHFILEVLQ